MRPTAPRPAPVPPIPARRRPRPSGCPENRGSPGRGRARCGPPSQVLVVRAGPAVGARLFHLRDRLVEVLAQLVAPHLLSHLLRPARHALRVVLVDVGTVAVTHPFQPAFLPQDLGDPRAPPCEWAA